MQCMDVNVTKMYTHYKGHLGSNNSCMMDLERQLSAMQHAPRAQAQDEVSILV